MRTFKHEKTGNVATEDILQQEATNGYVKTYLIVTDDPFVSYRVPAWMIEDQSCEWAEIIQKDYKILSYRTTDGHGIISASSLINPWGKEIHKVKRLSDRKVFSLGDNYRGYVIEGFQELDNILWIHFQNASYPITTIDKFPKPEKDYEILGSAGPSYCITKVKRLSDEQVFSVGNLHQSPYVNTCRIDTIYEKEGVIWLDHVAGATRLDQAVKVESCKPILTSEDGVELFEGDRHYRINKDTWELSTDVTTKSDPAKGYLYFSTREAAEEHRLNHARVLSLRDVRVLLPMGTTHITEELKELVKSRLK